MTMVKNVFLKASDSDGLIDADMKAGIAESLGDLSALKKILIIPPDISRLNSYAGKITRMIFELMPGSVQVDVMPALGTHTPMTETELDIAFPGIPHSHFLVHDWRHGVKEIGVVPADFINQISEGRLNQAIPIEVSQYILDKSYDLILSVGQVVPHEVAGMANYNKNIFIGCGGVSIINRSHGLGALYGMERMMGCDLTPVHQLLDYAEANFLDDPRIIYMLTVTTTDAQEQVHVHSLAIGRGRDIFSKSIKVSQQKNITYVAEPLNKAVVYLRPDEFKSTWLGNKAIYRTRLAMADGGELLVLAPGIHKFGEDPWIDLLIRKYGYLGTPKIMSLMEENEDLRENLGVAAHLIHGSSEGRFTIRYAAKGLSREETESVGYEYLDYDSASMKYDPTKLKPGLNRVGDEQVYFINNPALGLWALKGHFDQE